MPVCRHARQSRQARVRAVTSVIRKALTLSTFESLPIVLGGMVGRGLFVRVILPHIHSTSPFFILHVYDTISATSSIHSCTLLAETVPASVYISTEVVENCSPRPPNQHQVFPGTSNLQRLRASYLDNQFAPFFSSNLSEPFRPPPSAFKQAVTPRGYSEARSLERLEGPSIAPFARI